MLRVMRLNSLVRVLDFDRCFTFLGQGIGTSLELSVQDGVTLSVFGRGFGFGFGGSLAQGFAASLGLSVMDEDFLQGFEGFSLHFREEDVFLFGGRGGGVSSELVCLRNS